MLFIGFRHRPLGCFQAEFEFAIQKVRTNVQNSKVASIVRLPSSHHHNVSYRIFEMALAILDPQVIDKFGIAA